MHSLFQTVQNPSISLLLYIQVAFFVHSSQCFSCMVFLQIAFYYVRLLGFLASNMWCEIPFGPLSYGFLLISETCGRTTSCIHGS